MMKSDDFDQSEGKPREECDRHKFQKGFCQTYEDAFIWRFGYYIDIMQRFTEYLGSDKLIEMIKPKRCIKSAVNTTGQQLPVL